MKRTRTIIGLAVGCALAFGLTLSSRATADETLQATTTVNVRSGPGTDRSIIGYVAWGYTIEATGPSADGWTPVRYQGRAGYVSSQYFVSPGAQPSHDGATGEAWTTAYLNVRNGPSTSHQRLDTLPPGAKVTRTGRTFDDFVQIYWYNGERAWVASSWLSPNRDITGVPPVTEADPAPATVPAAEPELPAPAPSVPAAPATTAAAASTPPAPATSAALDPAPVVPATTPAAVVTTSAPPATTVPATEAATTASTTAPPAPAPAASTAAAPASSATSAAASSAAPTVAAPTAANTTAPATTSAAPAPVEPQLPTVPTVIGQKQAGSDLNLRAAATADSTILTVIPAGSTLDLVGPAENGRLPVLWQGQTGWVAEAYVIEVGAALPTPEAPPASIGQRYATDSLNVRTQPNTSAQVVGVLTRGQAIDITNQTDGNWQQVLYNGAVRWVSRDYLAAEPPRTAAAAQIAVDFAISKLGGPYVWGGNGPTGYDCSGLVRSAYQAAGISLPRVASAQATYGVPVSRQNIAVGDLVFYYSPISHVAIYVGNGQVVHASTYGVGIIRSDVDMATITAIRRMA